MAGIEDELVATIITTVLSFLAGFLLSILVERKKKSDARKDAASSLVGELRDMANDLSNHVRTDEKIDEMCAIFRKGTINTSLFTMKTAAYESVLFSGIFRDFDRGLQQQIAQVYDTVKLANTLEIKFVEISTVSGTVTHEFLGNLGMLLTTINTIERDLQHLVGLLITRLDEQFAHE